jgi:putative ABC transport system substrate-binding protein
VAPPLAARAQQLKVPIIGLHRGAVDASFSSDLVAGFTQGLKEAGFVNGDNLTIEYRWANIEYRWANAQPEQLPGLATDLIRRQAVVIVASGNSAAAGAKAAARSVPIAIGADPVNMGLVSSLNRPGGNLTGVSFLSSPTLALSMSFAAPRCNRRAHQLLHQQRRVGIALKPRSATCRRTASTGG